MTDQLTDADRKYIDIRTSLALDAQDPLSKFRQEFVIPTRADISDDHSVFDNPSELDEPCTYLCGNSLGLMPKQTRILVNEELDAWGKRGAKGHWNHPFGRPWATIDEKMIGYLAGVAGAKPIEVTAMNTLASNLHLMLITFFQPTKYKFKILMEANAFPNNQCAIVSHLESCGIAPDEGLITLTPPAGQDNLRTQDILDTIGSDPSIALVMLSGIHYYTGQYLDIPAITLHAQEKGCIVGWDLADAIGNVPLKLHDWNVDFACWCSYKYLNAGAGAVAGLFIHEKYAKDTSRPRLAGWWGNQKENRCETSPVFQPSDGASGYQQSSPNVLTMISLLSSLQIFDRAGGMDILRTKSLKLTRYMERMLEIKLRDHFNAGHIRLLTHANTQQRGCQLSLVFPQKMMDVFDGLNDLGVVCDNRLGVIRLAPVPLYNSFGDIYRAVMCLAKVMDRIYA